MNYDPNYDPNDPFKQRPPMLNPGLNPDLAGTAAIPGSQPPPGMPPPGAGGAGPLDPAMAQRATALPSEDMKKFQLARQYKLADALRADAKQQMGGKQVGRVYVGPKWWDAAASIGADAVGAYQDKKSREDLAGYTKDRGGAGMDILRAKGLLGPEKKKDDEYYTG